MSSKFSAALNARHGTADAAPERSLHIAQPEPVAEQQPVARRVGRPAGKRSNDANTQVTAYVPAQLYYDVRIKLLERKRKSRKASGDFSDLLREWMERWLSEQP